MIVVPMPPDPHREITEQLLRYMAESRMRRASEAIEQGIAQVQRALVERFPAHPLSDGMHQVWVRPDGAGGWQHLGYTSGPIAGIDFGQPDPGLVVVWPHQNGKRTVFSMELTFEGPSHGALMKVFEPFLGAALASRERRVARLAADLGLYRETARHQYDEVLRVLEAAGVADGYGRLTISQPVRPPIPAPARLG
ncbi:hypothetical protein OHA71_23675 [Streptomyces sp. NBC_00444]|uniref:hypothetical protein n=1 Tax=Streptomyces sp. NBC_00444 TaxID=2975744 RepID=UPI002E1A8F97